MFESIVTKCVQPKSVQWSGPTKIIMDLGDENGVQPYTLLKGADVALHKEVDIKPATSKEVYKKSESIWRNLKDFQIQKIQEGEPLTGFRLDGENVTYLINDRWEIIDIRDFKEKQRLIDFQDAHKQFVLELTTNKKTDKFFTDGAGGIVKLVCYRTGVDITTQDYVPIVLMEMNNEKSIYRVYAGILIYIENEGITFIPGLNSIIECKDLSSFIGYFNMDDCLKCSEEHAESLYELYQNFKKNPIEVSARELTNVLKKVGYKLEIDFATCELKPIEKLSDEVNNQKIQNFYNTFTFTTKESAEDILNLSELRKTFRYNEMTLSDLLSILSKEYLNYEGSKITAEVLQDIVYRLYNSKQTDKQQVETLKNEVK